MGICILFRKPKLGYVERALAVVTSLSAVCSARQPEWRQLSSDGIRIIEKSELRGTPGLLDRVLRGGLDLSDGGTMSEAINSPYEGYICGSLTVYRENSLGREMCHKASDAKDLFEALVQSVTNLPDDSGLRKTLYSLWEKNVTEDKITCIQFRTLDNTLEENRFVKSKVIAKLFSYLNRAVHTIRNHKNTTNGKYMDYVQDFQFTKKGELCSNLTLVPTTTGFEPPSKEARSKAAAKWLHRWMLRYIESEELQKRYPSFISAALCGVFFPVECMTFVKVKLGGKEGSSSDAPVPHIPFLVLNDNPEVFNECLKPGLTYLAAIPNTVILRHLLEEHEGNSGAMLLKNIFCSDNLARTGIMLSPDEVREFDARDFAAKERCDLFLSLEEVLQHRRDEKDPLGQTLYPHSDNKERSDFDHWINYVQTITGENDGQIYYNKDEMTKKFENVIDSIIQPIEKGEISLAINPNQLNQALKTAVGKILQQATPYKDFCSINVIFRILDDLNRVYQSLKTLKKQACDLLFERLEFNEDGTAKLPQTLRITPQRTGNSVKSLTFG